MGDEYLVAKRGNIMLDLSGGATDSIWATTEIDRAIQVAVSDISRLTPQEKFYDVNLDFTVTAESVTITLLDTAYALTYSPVKWNSVSVTNAAADTTYVENTDYYIDYANGTIECPTSGGTVTALDAVLVTYTRSKIDIDMSGVTGFIRAMSIEYPYGQIPTQTVSHDSWGDVVSIGTPHTGDQSEMSTAYHAVIKYQCEHTPPEAAAYGSYPTWMEQVVDQLAEAYLLMNRAYTAEHQAVTDLASMRTEMGLTTAVHTKIAAALVKVTTHCGEAGNALDAAITQFVLAAAQIVLSAGIANAVATTNAETAYAAAATRLAAVVTKIGNITNADAATACAAAAAEFLLGNTALDNIATPTTSATAILTQIATDIANLRTAINTAATAANAYLDEVDTTDLVGGEGKINSVNVGAQVTQNWVMLANARANAAMGYVNEMEGRLANLRTYIEQSLAYDSIANVFNVEGANRAAVGMGYVNEAMARVSLEGIESEVAKIELGVAQGYIDEGKGRAEVELMDLQRARIYVELAATYIQNGLGYVAEGAGRVDMAKAFSEEAYVLVSQVDRYLAEGDRYQAAANSSTILATTWREVAMSKRGDAFLVLGDKHITAINSATSSKRQNK